jgi:hypothetical protein
MVTAAIWDGFAKAAALKPDDRALDRMSQQQNVLLFQPDGMS